MPSTIVATPGSQSLADFQTVVWQQEGIFGPLAALGTQGQNNTITLNVGPSPASRAMLEMIQSDPPPARAGYDLVCSGDCLVGGQQAKVAAYRQQ